MIMQDLVFLMMYYVECVRVYFIKAQHSLVAQQQYKKEKLAYRTLCGVIFSPLLRL